MKKIVVPGELVSDESKKMIEGVYKSDGKIYSKYLGVFYDSEFGVKVVPLNGKYTPKIGDIIIGRIVTDDPFIYVLDVNSHLKSVLPKRDIENTFNVNDILLLRVKDVNEVKEISVELVSKLFKGALLHINPKKVARVIGKSKSMLEVIEKYTNSKITVGANGYIYTIGENISLVEETLEKIETYSHVDNLTEKVEGFLVEKTK